MFTVMFLGPSCEDGVVLDQLWFTERFPMSADIQKTVTNVVVISMCLLNIAWGLLLRQNSNFEETWGAEVQAYRVRRVGHIFTSLSAQLPVEAGVDQESSSMEYSQALQQRNEVCVAQAVGGITVASNPEFKAQIQQGRKAAASKGIIFAGLVRNIHESANRLFATLRAVGKSFAHHHIIVLENNSNDYLTKRGLKQECESSDTWCFLLDIPEMSRVAQDQGAPSRVKHLARLRQSLLLEVRKLAESAETGGKWDYVLMFDGDIFDKGSKGFHPTAIDALLGYQEAHGTVDVACGNQLANQPKPGRYRDTFALKMKSWEEKQRPNQAKDIYFKGNQLVPVKSCFSGLTLYTINAINTQCNYVYEGEGTCEHVPFNKCVHEKGHGRTAIYPPLVVHTNDGGVATDDCWNLS